MEFSGIPGTQMRGTSTPATKTHRWGPGQVASKLSLGREGGFFRPLRGLPGAYVGTIPSLATGATVLRPLTRALASPLARGDGGGVTRARAMVVASSANRRRRSG